MDRNELFPKPLNALVRERADELRPQWQLVTDAAELLIPPLLNFADLYLQAYTEIAQRLGHAGVKQLNLAIGISDTAASRLRGIAEAKTTLAPHAPHLPASLDALHALAVMAADTPAAFYEAVSRGRILSTMTVKEARRLQPPRRKSPTAKRTGAWDIALRFSDSDVAVTEIARLLAMAQVTRAKIADPEIRLAIGALVDTSAEEKVIPPIDAVRAKIWKEMDRYEERVRLRVRKALRSLAAKEHKRRVRRVLRKWEPNPSEARIAEAWRLVGFQEEEVYDGDLDGDAALSIHLPADVARATLAAAKGDLQDRWPVLVALEALDISSAQVAAAAVEARGKVKVPQLTPIPERRQPPAEQTTSNLPQSLMTRRRRLSES